LPGECAASGMLDEFLILQGSTRWNRTSVTVAAQALRSFFRHAERRGWCKSGIAEGIACPADTFHEGLPEGPTWTEVQRLLEGIQGKRASRLRARAILSLVRDLWVAQWRGVASYVERLRLVSGDVSR